MRAAWLLGLSAVLGQIGCGARVPAGPGKLGQRVEELAQREAGLQKQLDEISNRLFLLEDKVDTSRVAIERSKPLALPVIRIKPATPRTEPDPATEEESGAAAEETDEEPLGGRSVVARRSVLYEGEAGRDGPRPVLRLHEGGGGESLRPVIGSSPKLGAPLPGPDPAAVTDRIPVVPLPGREVVRAARADLQPMQEYQNALKSYQGGDYSRAAEAFRAFFKRYAQHAYADNALYWLGECAYASKNYLAALKLFRQVVEQYPSGNKAPDALLKMGYCYLHTKDKRNARTILGQVVESYPRSQVAKLASEAMAKL